MLTRQQRGEAGPGTFKHLPLRWITLGRPNAGGEPPSSLHCHCVWDKYRQSCKCLILPGALVLDKP